MKQYISIVSLYNACRLCNRLYRPHLIIYVHDGYQDGFLTQSLLQCRQLDPSVAVYRQEGNTEPFLLQITHRIDDGRVLDPGGDQMVSCTTVGSRRTDQRQIITFSASGGKKDLFLLNLQKSCKGLFCFFYILFCRNTFRMHRGRISVIFTHHLRHKSSYTLICTGRGRIIQIYFSHIIHFLIFYLITRICCFSHKCNQKHYCSR